MSRAGGERLKIEGVMVDTAVKCERDIGREGASRTSEKGKGVRVGMVKRFLFFIEIRIIKLNYICKSFLIIYHKLYLFIYVIF